MYGINCQNLPVNKHAQEVEDLRGGSDKMFPLTNR